MNELEFIKELKLLNIEASEEQLKVLSKYYNFLVKYNEHTNITSILNKEDVYLKHFYDSLTITKIVDLNEVNNVLDIGSGGGFPGLVLKIFYPNINLYVLDSNNKKIKFLEELSNHLNIKINLIHDRAEEYSKKTNIKFDLITARAVSKLSNLLDITNNYINKNNMFIAMKGRVSREIKDSKKCFFKNKLLINKKIEFNLPNDQGYRTLLKITRKD